MVDLRREFTNFLKYELGGIGRWVVVRHFTDEYSEFWKEETHEAVGGPAYEFVDTLVEVYSAPALSRTALRNEGVVIEEPGQIDSDFTRFFLEYDVTVNKNDEIFELDYEKSARPTLVYLPDEEDVAAGKVVPKERFKVKKIEEYRADEGRVEYKVAYAYKTIQR